MDERSVAQEDVRHRPAAGDLSDDVWSVVLAAVDRTYAELVDYQERLERKNLELEDLRRFLGSILASVSDVLIVLSRSGRVEEVSASMVGRTGFGKADLLGRPTEALVIAEDRPRLAELIARVTAARAPLTAEFALVTTQGSTPVEASISPRLDERGRVAGLVLTCRPLGELRQAYAALAASHRDLKSAQAQIVRNEKLASLGRLLAGVAHELNNPISFVYANTHAMDRYVTKFETYFDRVAAGAGREELMRLREELRLDREVRNLRTAVQGARDGAERVRDIVEDLRRLSADGAGEIVDFDLAACARVAAHWVTRGNRGDLRVEHAGPARLTARGRPGHVQQVVMNLVQNAVDALEGRADGLIRITLGAEGGMAVLEVADNGPGVPEAARGAIFDPFFTTKPVGRGTGLGLSISHKIAEEHGGRLVLVEGAGPGATFRLELPLGRETGR